MRRKGDKSRDRRRRGGEENKRCMEGERRWEGVEERKRRLKNGRYEGEGRQGVERGRERGRK